MKLKTTRTWAEISMPALEHNYRALRAMLPPGCRFLGVVKANAYGHGAVPVARRLEELGCEMLSVACLYEAEELRQGGVTSPILILGQTPPQFAPDLSRLGLTQTVGDLQTARALSAALPRGERLRIHIKVDTGMSRLGFLWRDGRPEEAIRDIAGACRLPGLEAEGIFTHFANADGDEDYTMKQFTRFLDCIDGLERENISFPIRHCAASAAVLNYPCTYLDMVRPGIALYGHYPDPSTEGLDGPGLIPVMSVYTRVAAVRSVPAGTPVSYGCTQTLARDSRLAVLPIGYGDGLPRALGGRFRVELDGVRVPIVGRVCMDMCMADVTDLPRAAEGDVAAIFGPGKPVEEAAALVGTIQYELLCGVSPRIPRIYLEGG